MPKLWSLDSSCSTCLTSIHTHLSQGTARPSRHQEQHLHLAPPVARVKTGTQRMCIDRVLPTKFIAERCADPAKAMHFGLQAELLWGAGLSARRDSPPSSRKLSSGRMPAATNSGNCIAKLQVSPQTRSPKVYAFRASGMAPTLQQKRCTSNTSIY